MTFYLDILVSPQVGSLAYFLSEDAPSTLDLQPNPVPTGGAVSPWTGAGPVDDEGPGDSTAPSPWLVCRTVLETPGATNKSWSVTFISPTGQGASVQGPSPWKSQVPSVTGLLSLPQCEIQGQHSCVLSLGKGRKEARTSLIIGIPPPAASSLLDRKSVV